MISVVQTKQNSSHHKFCLLSFVLFYKIWIKTSSGIFLTFRDKLWTGVIMLVFFILGIHVIIQAYPHDRTLLIMYKA